MESKRSASVLLGVSQDASREEVMAAHKTKYQQLKQKSEKHIGYHTNTEKIKFLNQMFELYAAALILYPDLEGEIDSPSGNDTEHVSLLTRIYKNLRSVRVPKVIRHSKKKVFVSPGGNFIETEVKINGSPVNYTGKEKVNINDVETRIKYYSNKGNAEPGQIISPLLKTLVLMIRKISLAKTKIFKIVVLIQLLFGIAALPISTYFEYLALNIMLSDPTKVLDPIIPIIKKPISFPLVILLEGTKATAILAVLYFNSIGIKVSKSLKGIIYAFRALLILLSVCSSMAVIYHFLYNAPLTKKMDAKRQEYISQYSVDTASVNSKYDPLIDTCKKNMEINNRTTSMPGTKFRQFESMWNYYDSTRQAKIADIKKGYLLNMNEENLEKEVVNNMSYSSANPILKAFNDSLKAIGISSKKGFNGVFFSFILAGLIELSIYVAFNLVALEFFKKKQSLNDTA